MEAKSREFVLLADLRDRPLFLRITLGVVQSANLQSVQLRFVALVPSRNATSYPCSFDVKGEHYDRIESTVTFLTHFYESSWMKVPVVDIVLRQSKSSEKHYVRRIKFRDNLRLGLRKFP